ncbi:MAG: M28 family peptidase [Acidobacteriota bacterium]
MSRTLHLLPYALAAVLAPGAIVHTGQPAPPPRDRAAADVAWAQGDYVTALHSYIALVKDTPGQDDIDAIALQTGELFVTEELTADGRAPRFSPNGRFAAYETDTSAGPVTRIVDTGGPLRLVAELPGSGASFSPSGNRVAYLRPGTSDDIAKTQAAMGVAPPGPERTFHQRQLDWLQFAASTIVVRDLVSGQDTAWPTRGLLKSAVFHGPGTRLYFLGARDDDPTRSDVYAIDAPGAAPAPVTTAPGFKVAPLFDRMARTLLYTETAVNPFARPEPGAALGGRRPGSGRGGGSGRYGLVSLETGTGTTFEGAEPALSADGTTVTYLVRTGTDTSVMVRPVGGEPSVVRKATGRMAAPALAPDNRRVAFQLMVQNDWEVFVIDADAKNETRITREIQHDVQPVFLTSDRLLAVMGEPRHRRSYLYDLPALRQTRVFHNNTVRTIAPEYAWVPSADGTKLLISAERDGDTVSPERGVYLVRLDTRITRERLLARLEACLASELAMRESARRMFAPIEPEVSRVAGRVSVDRIYAYEKALFDFDSKHVSRPGNRRAGEYLFNLYRSFGYQPEYQWFEPRQALGGKTANVLATLKGTTSPDVVYVVSSHYDSNTASPGADDNTSGTVALVEAARVLADTPLPASVIFASFTGEEAGLLGSREFVRRAVEAKWQLAGALNNDMIGWANDQRLDNTIRYSNAGIRDVQHAAAMRFSKLITYDALYYKATDAAAYYEAYGDIVGGIGSYPVLGSPHYHQPTDILGHVNHRLIAETGKATVASIMLLASSPSRLKDLRVARFKGTTAELTWAASPEKDVVRYVVIYGLPPAQAKARVVVTEPRVSLKNVGTGTEVAVKAVNTRGLEGWDWAKTTIGTSGR